MISFKNDKSLKTENVQFYKVNSKKSKKSNHFNFILGLAVDDIQAVQDNAILKRLAMQVELVLDVERLLPTFVLRRLSAQKVC